MFRAVRGLLTKKLVRVRCAAPRLTSNEHTAPLWADALVQGVEREMNAEIKALAPDRSSLKR